jgi:dienelactone hydrolase
MLGRRTALVLLISTLVGCGSDPPPNDIAVVPFQVSSIGPTPFGDIPWPSDLYLGADGHVGEVPNLARVSATNTAIQAGLSSLDGFARASGGLFFLPDPVDPASIPQENTTAIEPSAAVFFIDVDPNSPNRGQRYPAMAKYLPSLACLSIIPVPGVVLPMGFRHAIVVTDAVQTTDGRRLGAAPEFVRIGQLAANERQTAAEKLYGDAIEEIVKAKAVDDVDRIASLSVFTTSRRAEEMPLLRTRLREEPEPVAFFDKVNAAPYTAAMFGVSSTPSIDDWLGKPEVDEKGVEWPGGDNPGGIAHDAIAVVASGAFIAASFQSAQSNHIERDTSGAFLVADPMAKIPVTIVIPKSPMPVAGYPVIINGHGLSNNRGSMLSLANELARAGFAMIGIDDVLHGSRANIPDKKNNFKGTYAGPDGIPDDYPFAISFFAEFEDFVEVRDNFRQTILDQMSIVRLVQSSKLDLSVMAAAAGGQTPKFDGAHIYWNGGSLGGIMGSMAIALEPEIKAAALEVPGASFIQLITTNSAEVSGLVGTVAKGTFGIQGEEVLDEYHPIANLLSSITEGGDPIAYAPHILQNSLNQRETPDVMITYALHDEVLPNISTVALMRAMGIDLATPNLIDIPGLTNVPAPVSGNRGTHAAAAVQYSPADHALGYNRYDQRKYQPNTPSAGEIRFPLLDKAFNVEMPIREHSAALATFFSTALAGAARIEITATPVADFDGDGAVDTNDVAPYDPTVK